MTSRASPEHDAAPRRTRRLRQVLVLAGAAWFVALLAYGLTARAPDTTIDDALARNQPVAAPALDLAVLDGGAPGPLGARWNRAAADRQVNLDELRGTPVVMNLWASWCAPCREEAPVLQRGWEAARGQRVLFLGVNMQDVRSDALRFLREFDQDFPQVRDPGDATARAWGATGIPETFFVSASGRIVGHVIGTVSADQLASGVQAAREGRPLGTSEGGDRRPTQ